MTSYEEVMKDCVCSQAFSRLCHSYWNKSSFRVLRDVLKDDESDLLVSHSLSTMCLVVSI